MPDKVFSYLNDHMRSDEHAPYIERNLRSIELIAKHLGAVYEREHRTGKIPKDGLLVPHDFITLQQAQDLGITSPEQIFGGAIDNGTKTIFHVPISKNHPESFPIEFAETVKEAELVLPGFTAFSVDEIKIAYKRLRDEGYVPRIKRAMGSGGKQQEVLREKEDLRRYVNLISPEIQKEIETFGIVLEANLLDVEQKTPVLKAYAVSEFTLDNKTYSRVGTINYSRSDQRIYHSNTRSILSRGAITEIHELLDESQLDEYRDVINKGKQVIDLFGLAEGLVSLMKVNLCNGVVETYPWYTGDPISGIFVMEATTRIGGSAAIEAIAVPIFQRYPNVKRVVADYWNNFGRERQGQFSDKSVIFLSNPDIQMWVDLLEPDLNLLEI